MELVAPERERSPDMSELSFKALKHIVKVQLKLGRFSDMLASYSELLVQINENRVNRNRAEKAINTVMDLASAINGGTGSPNSSTSSSASSSSSTEGGAKGSEEISRLYAITLESLAKSKGNEVCVFRGGKKRSPVFPHKSDRRGRSRREGCILPLNNVTRDEIQT